MKRYLLLLVLAIFCLPNNSFAQFYSTIFGEEAERQRSISLPFNFHEHRTEKKQKPRIHYTVLSVVEKTTDEATGLTTLSWADGSSYVGEIYRTVFHGMGTMIYPDKGKYHGQWKYSHRDGIGTMEYADGSKYVGEWVRDLPNGSGTFINPEGIAFTGKFKDGIPHGKCVMQDIDGRKYTARWYYGKLREKSIKPLEEEK